MIFGLADNDWKSKIFHLGHQVFQSSKLTPPVRIKMWNSSSLWESCRVIGRSYAIITLVFETNQFLITSVLIGDKSFNLIFQLIVLTNVVLILNKWTGQRTTQSWSLLSQSTKILRGGKKMQTFKFFTKFLWCIHFEIGACVSSTGTTTWSKIKRSTLNTTLSQERQLFMKFKFTCFKFKRRQGFCKTVYSRRNHC